MDFLSAIERIAGKDCVMQNERMEKHTTFRVGGPARYFVVPKNADDIASYIRCADEADIPYTVVGNGSNLLVSDDGYRGMIIFIGKNLAEVFVEGTAITAGAGVTLAALAQAAYAHGLTGLEFAAGIPGTLGGAVKMNAGAYGGEMKDVLESVRTVTQDRMTHVYPKEALGLAYRRSIFMERKDVITQAVLRLRQGDEKMIAARMEELAARRRQKQPLEYPSAGSTFCRPKGHFAGELIEAAGLKGKGVGGARVSEKHAGFIINYDHATAKDIFQTILLVQDKVFLHSGVKLEPEIQMLGTFS